MTVLQFPGVGDGPGHRPPISAVMCGLDLDLRTRFGTISVGSETGIHLIRRAGESCDESRLWRRCW